jgi:hypothetical protein
MSQGEADRSRGPGRDPCHAARAIMVIIWELNVAVPYKISCHSWCETFCTGWARVESLHFLHADEVCSDFLEFLEVHSFSKSYKSKA